jgi:hypothetical protein
MIRYGCTHRTSGTEASLHSSRITLLSARDDVAGVQATTTLTVNVDATRTVPTDLQALPNALAGGRLESPPQDGAQPTDWLVWGHLNGQCAPISLDAPAAFPVGSLGLYAAGSADTKTVCLVNRGPDKVMARVLVRLPHGTYTIERLTLSPRIDEQTQTGTAVSAVDHGDGAPVSAPAEDQPGGASASVFRLDRLEGRDLSRAAVVGKSGMLEPGQVVFYRFTDQSRLVETAFAETYRLLAELEKSRPGPAHRLRRMLREGDHYRSGVRAGNDGVASRLESIHNLLLVTGQAQSLHRNYQMRGTVPNEIGAALMGSLERLMDGLAEVTATLLDLVPQVTVEPIGERTPGKANAVPVANAPNYELVTVALANGGEHSIEMVKLGLDISGLPATISCDPPDPAFFGTLKPGQTVRATFRLRCPSGVAVVKRLCVADVCYRAGGGPAHLRPRPW